MKVTTIVRFISLSLLVVALLAWASALSANTQMPPTKSGPATAMGIPNGTFRVAVLRDGTWQGAGELSFDQFISEQQIDLSSLALTSPAQVRVVYQGGNAAHIDTVTLGGQTPSTVLGASESPALVAKKLARLDYDVIDAAGKTLTFIFELNGQIPVLMLAARIEADKNPGVPFEFPSSNRYGAVDRTSQFYTYRLNSVPGTLKMNGELNEENLGGPFFKEWSQPITGHPSNFTFGWVRNDASNLYIAIDFTPDNAYDGDKDYTAVYVKTANGVMRFRVSVPEQQWGIPGFVYTDQAVYQHKVYEYKIPLAQIDASVDRDGMVELAFEAYGTAAVCLAGFHFVLPGDCVKDTPPVVPIFANRVAPKTSTIIGSSGGSLDSPGGDGTVTAPAGSAPAGGQLSISQPNQNGLPRGTFVLRGDGDHWDAVSVTDANGNPVYSFAPPGLTFCFNLSASEVANANGPLTIQMWDGGKWVDVVFTFTAGTPNKLCTTFTGL